MTFAIFIVLIFGVLVALLNALPNVSSFGFDAGYTISAIIAYARSWDFLLPIHETILVTLAVISIDVAIWIWHASWRVIKFLRGHSDGA